MEVEYGEKMAQEITIAANSEVPIKPLIESAIRSELERLDLAILRTERRLRMFEEKYDMPTDQFENKFGNADLSETLDYIEWYGEVRTMALLYEQKKALTGVNFVD